MSRFRFMELIKPYKLLITGAVVSLVLFNNLGLTVPWMLKIIIDKVLPTGDMKLLYMLILAILMIYAVRSVLRYMAVYMIHYTGQRALFDVRTKLFRHLQNLSMRFFQKYRTGKLLSNVFNDVAMFGNLIHVIMGMADNIIQLLLILCLLFLINVKLALICLLFIPLQFANFMYFKNNITRNSITLREKMSEISANFAETITGVKIVKSFSMERAELRSFVTNLRPTMNMNMKINMDGSFCWLICDLLSLFTILAVMSFGAVMINERQLTIGEFVAFYTYVGMVLGPINNLTNLSSMISQGLAGAEKIMDLLDARPDVKESPHPLRIGRLTGKIDFKEVCFGYEPDKKAIRDFTLSIRPGQKVALVGPSGSGKSTITNLLLRFYDVDQGVISVDGKDIRRLKFESFRKQFGVVMQEPFLFSGSIAENIAYANPDATPEQIEEAARKANVEEFVSQLEEGYETELGENGASLSGGQKQRIAIARALLKDPAILILDEATSALDTVSEYLVQEALDRLMEGKTTIIIAHRLSTIKNADVIVVMDQGRIVQLGTHDELLKVPGVYRDMYLAQEKTGKEGFSKPELTHLKVA